MSAGRVFPSHYYGDPANCIEAVRRDERRTKAKAVSCGTCGNWLEGWGLTGCAVRKTLDKNNHCGAWRARG